MQYSGIRFHLRVTANKHTNKNNNQVMGLNEIKVCFFLSYIKEVWRWPSRASRWLHKLVRYSGFFSLVAPPWPMIITQILAVISAFQPARGMGRRAGTLSLRTLLGSYLYPIGQDLVTQTHLAANVAARLAGKCSFCFPG